MNAIIEMGSREEMRLFGDVFFKFGLLVLVAYFALEAAGRLIKAKHQRTLDERKIARRYTVEPTEFEELGRAAINHQRMLSFIAETAGGRNVEITVDEILEEVKERGDRVDYTE